MRARDAGGRSHTPTVSAPAEASLTFATGTYLTDGTFLYRIVGFARRGADASVELEDCFLLDVVRVSASSIRGRQMRVVVPSRDPSGTAG